ncbi:MAG: NACHT domain-containing protein [Pseudonocardiaceae bacterium]
MNYLRQHPVVGSLVAAVVAATVGMLLLGSRGATIASVLGAAVGMIALLVTLVEAHARSGSNDRLLAAARRLARDVRSQEAGALTRLMADSGDPKPAEVSFAQPARIYWRTDGGNRQGTLREVAGYYRGLDRGRMVVLGEPGAGKTILAIQLVLDLAAAVLDVADDTTPLPRVPVRVSLPAFDPGIDVDVVATEVVSARFDRWLIRHLMAAFGLSAKVAATLVTDGWILPVLDGLDEMDLDTAVLRRAASVVRAINYPSAGTVRPVVITCRTNRYHQLSGHFESARKLAVAEQETASTAGRREVVQDATVIGVEPLTASTVISYLTYRFLDPADPHQIESRWRPITERLADADGGDDPLAAALSSPLRLFLAITAYSHPSSTPSELTRLSTAAQFDEHLFARLVPAVLEQHPPGRGYTAAEVMRWLTTLAHHLAWQGERGGSSSDLRLDQLWPAAGLRAARYAASVTMTAVASALLAFGVVARWPPDVLPVLGMGAFVVVTGWIAAQPRVDLRRLDFSGLATSTGRRRVKRLLAIGLAVSLVNGLMLAPISTAVGFVDQLMLTFKLVVLGLVVALMVGLGSGPTTRPTAIDRPGRLVQQGMVHTIAAIIAVSVVLLLTDKLVTGGLDAGVVGGLVAGLGVLLALVITIGPAVGIAAGLAVGLSSSPLVGPPVLVLALVTGLVFAANSPWPRYLFATMFLAHRGELPRRPAVFVDWAYQAGLMRLSGISVQFRHREFQTWLTTLGPIGADSQSSPTLAGWHESVGL